MSQPPVEHLDLSRMNRTMLPNVLILGLGSVVGCFVGGAFFVLSGVGAIIGFAVMFYGPFIVPLWALWRGKAGQKKAFRRLQDNLRVELFPDEHPLNVKVQTMAKSLGLPPVKYVGWFPAPEINAFASGLTPDNAMVCLSSGTLDKLEIEEVDAVIGHELAHVVNGDMKRMNYARNVQESITWVFIFARVKMIVRWLFTTISELSILKLSRTREYHADALGAVIASPQGMMGALRKIKTDSVEPARGQLMAAHLMMRANPASMFSTHPTIEQRLKALESGEYIRRLPWKGDVPALQK